MLLFLTTRTRLILSSLVLIIAFTSCIGAKRYTRFVDAYPSDTTKLSTRDWLEVVQPFGDSKGNVCTQVRSSFIPAIFYTEWNSTILCNLDETTTTAFMRNGIYKAADDADLQRKLKGRKLEVQLTQTPGKFTYENSGNVIYLILFYITRTQDFIVPDPIGLSAKFYILEDGKPAYEGVVHVDNMEFSKRRTWQSKKKLSWQHIDELKVESERMGLEVVNEVIRKLRDIE